MKWVIALLLAAALSLTLMFYGAAPEDTPARADTGTLQTNSAP